MEDKNIQLVATQNKLPIARIEHRMDDLIKPLVKDVFLCNTYISRSEYDKVAIKELGLRGGIELTLIREKSRINEQDIAVYTKDKTELGYVLEKDLMILANLMDAGKLLYAVIDSIDTIEAKVFSYKSSVLRIRLKVFMRDI